jgi:hypothetical protein
MEIAHDDGGVGAALLQKITTKTHGNHRPEEWTNHTLPTWEDERRTRKGEGTSNYVHDPKFRKRQGRATCGTLMPDIESKMPEIQETMQSTGEERFGPGYGHQCLDGVPRPKGFPKRPVPGREKHGGGIGKKMQLLTGRNWWEGNGER